ncbi:unnamed protein product [Lactuca saligna]|uniref:Transcriptional coactivator Hfi1/Transcriptional adapter 1 n=1 Tax=Lactuca saligna TaxID=75948 RepID=A0AA36E5D5_LACSI|nr:unnamed protein product [Lactuca saligna]
MQPPQHHSLINLGEIKGQLIKKLGLERSKQYLDYLNLFLSFKLSKPEFDKLCLRTVGKDNIRLHNQLIRAVLKNACTAKSSIPDDPSTTVGNKKPLDGVYHQNGGVTIPLALANGDILPPSPRKARSGARERRVVDRKSALGPNGKTNYTSISSSFPQSGDFSVVLENGNSSSSPDTRNAAVHHHHQELKKQPENGDFVGVHRIEHTESLVRKDGKGVSVSVSVSDRASLHAPLGVPFCPVSVGGARALPSSSKTVSVLHTDGLLETPTLKERMEQIVTAQGLQRVSMDCANVMNIGLDSYLKGLIRSCIELNGAKSMQESMKSDLVKHPAQMRSKQLATLLDFRVAMELNPKQLGEDWPVLLEKISTHAFEE